MRNWNFQSTLCSHSFSFHSATLEDSRFAVGERVCVKQSCSGRPPSMWRRPHWPVPGKLEAPGRVVKKLGMRSDPTFFTFCEELGLAKVDTEEPCYLVEFPLPQGDPRKKETRGWHKGNNLLRGLPKLAAARGATNGKNMGKHRNSFCGFGFISFFFR